MARQADLVKIGKEGFAILEAHFGQNKKQQQKPLPADQEVQHHGGRANAVMRPMVNPIGNRGPVNHRNRGAQINDAVVITETKNQRIPVFRT